MFKKINGEFRIGTRIGELVSRPAKYSILNLLTFSFLFAAISVQAQPPSVTNLYSFSVGTNGYAPIGGLIQGTDGNFYGTTEYGGEYDDGTVFKMTPSGTVTTLLTFNFTNGMNPVSPLTHGSDGNLYGTTLYGGTNGGWGTIFSMTTNGVLNYSVSLGDANGAEPGTSLLQGADGNFYGVTYDGGMLPTPPYYPPGQIANDGTVFMMTPSGTLT